MPPQFWQVRLACCPVATLPHIGHFPVTFCAELVGFIEAVARGSPAENGCATGIGAVFWHVCFETCCETGGASTATGIAGSFNGMSADDFVRARSLKRTLFTPKRMRSPS